MARLEAIRDCLRRGLSPEQMAARNGGPVDLSPSTIYHWVSAGYDGMTNMELRRKVGYRPRKRTAGRAATRHSARRSHAAFLALGEDACAAAWEMDTVERAREDSACLLTLLHRPSRLQLALCLCQVGNEQCGTRNLSSLADGLVKRSPFRASAPHPCGGSIPRTR